MWIRYLYICVVYLRCGIVLVAKYRSFIDRCVCIPRHILNHIHWLLFVRFRGAYVFRTSMGGEPVFTANIHLKVEYSTAVIQFVLSTVRWFYSAYEYWIIVIDYKIWNSSVSFLLLRQHSIWRSTYWVNTVIVEDYSDHNQIMPARSKDLLGRNLTMRCEQTRNLSASSRNLITSEHHN